MIIQYSPRILFKQISSTIIFKYLRNPLIPISSSPDARFALVLYHKEIIPKHQVLVVSLGKIRKTLYKKNHLFLLDI